MDWEQEILERLPQIVVRRFKIERFPRNPDDDYAPCDSFPWYVTETTYGDDRDDRGSMATHRGAVTLMLWMLRNPPGSPSWLPELDDEDEPEDALPGFHECPICRDHWEFEQMRVAGNRLICFSCYGV